MFEMRGISKAFGAVQALKGASLSVKPGEICALLGANGSGKSTMVKVLAGLVRPDAGKILIDGKPVQIGNSSDSKKLGIVTAFQDLSLIPTMKVADNIKLNRERIGRFGMIDSKKDREDVVKLLERFHIHCDPDAYAQTLMPSTQSMLEVAKAVHSQPRLLLLDEVTATLHQDEIEVLFGVLRELRAANTAIIYVTHRMKEVARLCDSAVIMRNGESVCRIEGSELEDLDQIVYYMTGKRPEKCETARPAVPAAAREDALLEVRHIRYSPKVADISLTAHRGEIIGIGGLDGQGQSEFIRLVLGEYQPESGEILYRGQPVRFNSPAESVRRGIGFISGERNREAIFDRRTIAENLYVGESVQGKLFRFIPNRRMLSFSRDAVEKYNVKIGALRDAASSLSGGNQQKLVVARWIAVMPDLLLLDDPTKGVDINSRREIHQILRECAGRNMTVIVSSSDNDELMDLADVVYVFYEGRVAARLVDAEKTQERLVAEMMGMSAKEERSNA